MSEEIKNEEVVEETQDTSTTDNAVEEITETPVENNETPTEETEVSNEEENTDVAEETPVEEETTTEVSDEEEDSEEESGISESDEQEDDVEVPAISKGTIARTILLAIGLINLALTATGNSPLPFDSEDVNMTVSVIFDIIVSIVAWWKDNDFTVRARLLKANK